jgi:hypothetical protein
MDKKFNEFEVTLKYNKKGKLVIDKNGYAEIERKYLTARGHVMISDRDAEINNRQTRFNKLHYELAKVEKSAERIALEAEAKKLDVKFRDNIGDAGLLNKINEAKK